MTSRQCECGLKYVPGIDDEFHDKHHAEYLYGPSISAIAELQSVETVGGHPLFVIDHRVPLSQRKAFFRVALVAQGSMPEYPAGSPEDPF